MSRKEPTVPAFDYDLQMRPTQKDTRVDFQDAISEPHSANAHPFTEYKF